MEHLRKVRMLSPTQQKSPAGRIFLPTREGFTSCTICRAPLFVWPILHSALVTYLSCNRMESYAVPRDALIPPTEFHKIISFLRAAGIVMGTRSRAVRIVQTVLRLLGRRRRGAPGNALIFPSELHEIIPFLSASSIMMITCIRIV